MPTGDDTVCQIDTDASVLFPVKGVTASSISGSLHSVDEEESETDEDPELLSMKNEKKTLLIVVYALAGTCAVLIICIILTVCSGRRNKRTYVPVTGQKFGSSGEAGYTDPYDASAPLRH